MPPDMSSVELAFEVHIEDEPKVVPNDGKNEIASERFLFLCQAPCGITQNIGRMYDNKWDSEHEEVIAGERSTAREVGMWCVHALPGGKAFCPAVFAFDFDLDTGKQRRKDTEIDGFDENVQRTPPYVVS